MSNPIREAEQKVRLHPLVLRLTPAKLAWDAVVILLFSLAGCLLVLGNLLASDMDKHLAMIENTSEVSHTLSQSGDLDGLLKIAAYTDRGDEAVSWLQAVVLADENESSESPDSKLPSTAEVIRRGYQRLDGLALHKFLNTLITYLPSHKDSFVPGELAEMKECHRSLHHFYAPEWWTDDRVEDARKLPVYGIKMFTNILFPSLMTPPCMEKSVITLLTEPS